MPRQQEEKFEQDRVGNVNRKLDEIRGEDGMHEDNGIVTISSETTEGVAEGNTESAEEVVYIFPNSVQRAYLQSVEVQNNSVETDDADATTGLEITYTITEVTLDEDDEVVTSDQRSLERTVSSDGDNDEDYSGRGFHSDGIAISAESAGVSGDAVSILLELEVGMSVIADAPEEHEPDSEQTAAPG